MRRRGWGGRPPVDDADARSRIIAAAIRMIERRGPHGTTLSDVAVDLGITRPTVYRHFATIDELLTVEEMLSACIRDRALLLPERSIDMRFDEFMADDLGMVNRIWELADCQPTVASRRVVEEYLSGHTRGRLGRIDYRPAELGLYRDNLRRRFAPYVERFVAA